VKNDSVIYHHLADVVAEEMQKINFGDGSYFNLDVGNQNFWLKWTSLIMSIIALLLTLYLCFCIHILASAMAMSKPVTAQITRIPDELIYARPSPNAQFENGTTWPTVQFEWPTFDQFSLFTPSVMQLRRRGQDFVLPNIKYELNFVSGF